MISKQPGMGVLPWDMKKRRCNYQGRNAAFEGAVRAKPLSRQKFIKANSRRQLWRLDRWASAH